MADAVGGKRGGQINLIFGRLLPKGYSRESFAGKTAHSLDQARIAELARFIEQAQKSSRVPGVALGLVQDGKVVFAGGFGVKELGGSEKPDADTLFMVASNTKALTTLLLAKLVDEHRITWQTPVTTLLPSFRLGDADTTRSVLVKHLICACTGMPRQDLEWIFHYSDMTPASSLTLLGTMQPTLKFGELFQYSNLMAAAAGYTAAYVIFPQMEFGAAYDRAMQNYVFDPLQMKSTTFDFKHALAGDHATPHSPDADGKPPRQWQPSTMRLSRCAPQGEPGAVCTICCSTFPWSLRKASFPTEQLTFLRTLYSNVVPPRFKSEKTLPTAWASWSTPPMECLWFTTAET